MQTVLIDGATKVDTVSPMVIPVNYEVNMDSYRSAVSSLLEENVNRSYSSRRTPRCEVRNFAHDKRTRDDGTV